MVFFFDQSPNKDIQDALRDAERVRKALREEEAEQYAERVAAAAAAAHVEHAEGAEGSEETPALTWRRVDRRSRPGGRSRS